MPRSSFDQALGEAKKAAQDLAQVSAKLTRRLLAHAERAAKDPRGSVERAARKAAREMESAAHEIDEVLKRI